MPEQVKPVLTRQTLAAWAEAKGLCAAQSAERKKAHQLILAAATVNPRSDALTYLGHLSLNGCTAVTHLPEGLCVQGDLILDGCTALTHLPEGLCVQGCLDLNGCAALTRLPARFFVQGDISLNGCTAVTHLPKGLGVQDCLNLFRCTALTHLPEGLCVQGALILNGCTALTHLPKGLCVQGDLNLSYCSALSHMPEDLSLPGHLDLCSCTALTHLPEGLSVQGDLDLNGCSALTHLPTGLRLQGGLSLIRCTALSHLPEGLCVQGYLDLSGCSALTHLPEGLSVQGYLDLSACAALTHLPEGLCVQGDLYLDGCTALAQLPKGLCVQGDLYLDGCTALTHLPEGLCVQGALYMDGCTALTHLPEGLCVQGPLYLDGCTALTHLPEDLCVQGNLYADGCSALTALPQSILCWGRRSDGYPHAISLQNTGISLQTQQRLDRWLSQLDPRQRGVHLYFFEDQATDHPPFNDLQQAWSCWQQAALDSAFAPGGQLGTDAPSTHPFMHLDAAGQATLTRYLAGLRETAEYRNRHTRPVLIARVGALATGMRNLVEAEAALAVLEVAMSSCEDRLISGLDQIEQGLRVRAALRTGNLEELRALGLAELKLQVVREHARAKAQGIVGADEVEVYLVYETRLAEELDLPVATRTMRYSAPDVTEADLLQAAAAAQAAVADPNSLAEFLQAWPPWQQAQRDLDAKELRYDAIEFMPPLKDHTGSACIITQESFSTLTEPVTAVGKTWVAELSELLTWWVKDPIDPTNREALALTSLRRLRELK